MEPCRRHDVGASLLFEENCQPERQIGAVWRAKLGSRALLCSTWSEDEDEGKLSLCGIRMADREKLNALEALAGNDGDELHFTQKGGL